MTVIVTGASGMIGAAIVAELQRRKTPVRILSRTDASLSGIERRRLPPAAGQDEAFERALEGGQHLIHCAALNNDDATATPDMLNEVNAALTGRLAKAACRVVPGRFIFLSSIRAIVDAGWSGTIDEKTEPRPASAYGFSKLAGEREVQSAYEDDGRAISLRMAPVYGSSMRGAMRTLFDIARTPWPLPIGSIRAQRSVLSLASAVQAALLATELEPAAASYILSDARPISLQQIITSYRLGLGRQPGIFSFPPTVFSATATLLGKRARWEDVTASQICDSSAFAVLGWQAQADSRVALAALARNLPTAGSARA